MGAKGIECVKATKVKKLQFHLKFIKVRSKSTKIPNLQFFEQLSDWVTSGESQDGDEEISRRGSIL